MHKDKFLSSSSIAAISMMAVVSNIEAESKDSVNKPTGGITDEGSRDRIIEDEISS